ncbi:acyltransferase family protein [Modestobacter versicolor]|nr:acyltransferase [Modestobacter versicolor]
MTAGSTAPPARGGWTDPTKGLAMFMVVAYHVTLYLQSADVDAVLGRAKAVFELFPMPAFFLIAGIFAGRHGEFRLGDLWRRRLLSLLYLYVLWSVVRTVFYLVVPGLNGELGEIDATDPLALPLILLWPSSSYWFLYALFLFTLLRHLVARAPVWAQLAGSGVVSTLFTTGVVDTGNIGWNRVGALFFFFVLGAVRAQWIRRAVTAARPVHLLLALVALAVVTGLIVLGLSSVPFVVLAGQTVAVATGILVCAQLVRFRAFSRLSTLGTNSLKVYLLHLYVIVPAVALIGLADTAAWPRSVAVGVQVALTAATLVASLLLARLTSRVRWLYAPPGWLRRSRLGTARPSTPAPVPAPVAGPPEAVLAPPTGTPLPSPLAPPPAEAPVFTPPERSRE